MQRNSSRDVELSELQPHGRLETKTKRSDLA